MSVVDFANTVRVINELWNTRFDLKWKRFPDGSYGARIVFEGDSYELQFQRFPEEILTQSTLTEGKEIYNFAFTRNNETDVESRGKIPTKVLGGIFNEFESFMRTHSPAAVTVTAYNNDEKRMRVYLHAINKMIKTSNYIKHQNYMNNPANGSVYVVLSRKDVSKEIAQVIMAINTQDFSDK